MTAFSGVWMRLFPFSTIVHKVAYDHILHAHSHIAILGWTFLATVLIYMYFIWNDLPNTRQARAIIWTTSIITFVMFFAFLYEGYALYSIVLSMLHIFIEYWVVIFIWRTLRYNQTMPNISRRFIQAGSIMLIISSIGPLSLGAIASMGLRDSPIFDMAIYFYLHFQYNGWLYFMLIGFIIIVFQRRNIILHRSLLQYSFTIYLIALIPGFLLSILWFNLGKIGYLIATVGGIGQFIGVAFFILAIWCTRKQIQNNFDHLFRCLCIISFSLLFIKSILELGLSIPTLSAIVYDTRHIVIGYLHLTLLGFISLLLFGLFHVTNLVKVNRQMYQFGIYSFIIGFFLNEFVLFMAALFHWIGWMEFPLQNSLLFIASMIMLISVCFIWYPTNKKEIVIPIDSFSTKSYKQ